MAIHGATPGENIDESVRALACARHLPQPHLDRWLAMNERSRAAFLEIAQTLRLRTGQITAALELLEEISVRDATDCADILAAPEIARIRLHAGSAPARARELIETLRARRFPRLRETSTRLEGAIRELRLPRGISVVLPRELRSDVLTITVEVARVAELDGAIEALAARRAAIARIIEMLGGSE